MIKNAKNLIILLLIGFLIAKCSAYRTSNIQHSTEKSTSLSNKEAKLRHDIVTFAKKYKGTKYRGGGTTPKGFDCSGFTTFVMNHFDIKLHRSAADQTLNGKKIPIKGAKKGDLLFFETKSGRINHVGLVVSNDGNGLRMIHSSSSRGIVVDEVYSSSYWNPRLKMAKSML